MIKEIKTIIATTLPDQLGSKYTKNVLRTFADQINNAIPRLKVINRKGIEIGEVKFGSVSKGELAVTMNIDIDSIDKAWEYYFIPEGIIREKEQQGKFMVITKAAIKGISMVMFPTDLSLKPIRFEEKTIEGRDYFIKKYDEIDEKIIADCIDGMKPLYVYYPQSLDPDVIKSDAEKRGLIQDGNYIHPIEVYGWPGSFTQFRNIIIEEWTKANSQLSGIPLKKATEKQS